MTSGYYSIMQFVRRYEAVNVGVVIWQPGETVIVRVTESFKRIEHVFGIDDEVRLWSELRAIVNRLKSANFCDYKEFVVFVGSECHNFTLTTPNTMMLPDPQKDLDSLFEEVVIDKGANTKMNCKKHGEIEGVHLGEYDFMCPACYRESFDKWKASEDKMVPTQIPVTGFRGDISMGCTINKSDLRDAVIYLDKLLPLIRAEPGDWCEYYDDTETVVAFYRANGKQPFMMMPTEDFEAFRTYGIKNKR